MRQADIQRNTQETRIRVRIDLDGSGRGQFRSGVPFLDHMLDQIARHGMIDIEVEAEGKPLVFKRDGDVVHVALPEGAGDFVEIDFSYGLKYHDAFDGVMMNGLTFLWPYFCENVYPCKSDPTDGLKFKLELMETFDGVAVYPETIPADAPAYQLAWAIGDYERIDRGATSAGTKVEVWHLAANKDAAELGTAKIKDYFQWLETNLGKYLFGSKVASVEAGWGPGGYGGMEHHPYWHVGTLSMADATVHAHEAAHGWYGDGIRIACWGDFVLSEGTVSYLTARIIEDVDGAAAGTKIWADYQDSLKSAQDSAMIKTAWHPECDPDLDLLAGYFSSIPYMKGAFFFRALERAIGREPLDAALKAMYAEYGGQSAHFADLLDIVKKEADFDPLPCAMAWLTSKELPDIEASCAEF